LHQIKEFQIRSNSRGSHGETGLRPGRHPAFQGFDLGKPLLLILSCQTGRGVFVGSGAIENNFLVFGQGRDFGPEFRGQERPGEMNVFAVIIAAVGTDQKTMPGF
jgi:hypothetical protein